MLLSHKSLCTVRLKAASTNELALLRGGVLRADGDLAPQDALSIAVFALADTV